jgi:WD40 repeat protein
MRYITWILIFISLSNVLIIGQAQSNLLPITSENIDRLVQLQVMGRGSITALALSSDEAYLAVGTKAGVWLYETADLSNEPFFLPHLNWVAEIAFSPDDLTLAVIGFNDYVRVWTVANQQLLWEINNSLSTEWFREDVAFDDTGTTLTAVVDGQVIVFETTTGNEIKRFSLYQDSPSVAALSLSKDGKLLAISIGTSLGGRLDLWDVESGEMLWSAEVGPSAPDQSPFVIWSFAFHPAMPMLAAGTNSGEISLWNIESGEVLYRISETFGVTDLHFANDGDYIVSATSGGFVHFWDTTNYELYSGIENRIGSTLIGFSDLSISDNAEVIYAAGSDDRLIVWERDNQTFNLVNTLDEFGSTYTDTTIAYVSTENVVLTATGDATAPSSNRLHAWDLQSSEQEFTITDFDFISEIFISGDTIIGRNNSVKFWSYQTRDLILTLNEHEGQRFYPSDIALNSNGNLLAIAQSSDYYGNGTSDIFIWDVAQQKFITRLSLTVDFIEAIAFNPIDEQIGFVTRSIESDGVEVMLWNYLESDVADSVIETTSDIAAIKGLMAFHPNGNLIAYYGDNTVWIYEFTNQISTPVMEILQTTLVENIAFSPGGDLITIGILDATTVVSIANLENPSLVANIPGLQSIFIEDGTRLLTIGRDGVIRVWGIPNA